MSLAGNGRVNHTIYTRALPLYQTEGLPSLISLWPTPSPRGRAPDTGYETTGHGGVPQIKSNQTIL